RTREQVPVGAARARYQPQRRCQGSDAEREVGKDRGRDVKVEQSYRLEPLVLAGRRDVEREPRGQRKQREHHKEEESLQGHASSNSGPNATTPAATIKTANATSNCTHGHASLGAPSSAAANARVAPSMTGTTAGSTSNGTSVSRARN